MLSIALSVRGVKFLHSSSSCRGQPLAVIHCSPEPCWEGGSGGRGGVLRSWVRGLPFPGPWSVGCDFHMCFPGPMAFLPTQVRTEATGCWSGRNAISPEEEVSDKAWTGGSCCGEGSGGHFPGVAPSLLARAGRESSLPAYRRTGRKHPQDCGLQPLALGLFSLAQVHTQQSDISLKLAWKPHP